jgi:hypothetical protein
MTIEMLLGAILFALVVLVFKQFDAENRELRYISGHEDKEREYSPQTLEEYEEMQREWELRNPKFVEKIEKIDMTKVARDLKERVIRQSKKQ